MKHKTNQKNDTGGDARQFEEGRWSHFTQTTTFRHSAAMACLRDDDHSILDVGCGDSLMLEKLSDHPIPRELTGIDFSATAIKHARQRIDGVTFIEGDIAQTLPFDDCSFDVVMALDVLEHLHMPHKVLREMGRVSRKALVIGVPNFSSLPARIQMLFGRVPENNRPKKGHVYWFTYSILQNMLAQEGYEIVEMQYNYQKMNTPVVGKCIGVGAKWFPGLFPLSYIVRAEKAS